MRLCMGRYPETQVLACSNPYHLPSSAHFPLTIQPIIPLYQTRPLSRSLRDASFNSVSHSGGTYDIYVCIPDTPRPILLPIQAS